MFAMMVLPPFTLEGAQDEVLYEDGAMLNMPEELPPALVQAIHPVTENLFRRGHSRMAGASYWMNHCEYCDAKQGDHFVQGPDGPFWPYDEAQMQAIEATRLEGPFRLPDASTSYSGAMADWRDWKHGVVRPPPPVRKPRKRRTPPSSASRAAGPVLSQTPPDVLGGSGRSLSGFWRLSRIARDVSRLAENRVQLALWEPEQLFDGGDVVLHSFLVCRRPHSAAL